MSLMNSPASVAGRFFVQYRGVTRGEVLVDLLRRHPPVQGLGCVGVARDRVFSERPVELVGLLTQPRDELADRHLP
jgi:hypothetical protein